MYPLFLLFFKFCIVGVSGMMVDFGLTWLLKEKARWNSYIANSCGFIVAATSNYILNRVWTFYSHEPRIVAEYLHFLGIAVIGVCINNLIVWLLFERMKWRFYLSKLIATGFVTIWNFGMNYLITFAN